LPPLPQGCPGLHQHLQHAPDVLPDAGTSTTMAHQPHGLCEKWQDYPRLPPPISQHPQLLPWIAANCPGPKFCSPPTLPPSTCIPSNPITQTQGRGWGLNPFRPEYLYLPSWCKVWGHYIWCIPPVGSVLSPPPVILSTFSWAIPPYRLPWPAPPLDLFP